MSRWTSSESEQQQSLFEWAAHKETEYPELFLLHSTPNEGSGGNARLGSRMAKQGMKAGVPDVKLPVPRGEYGGLFVEMKYDGGKLRASQKEWLRRLRDAGNAVAVAYRWHRAAELIINYLEEEWPEPVLDI